MNRIKGFIAIPAINNNAEGQTAIFGELTTYSKTFSKQQSSYVNPSLAAGIELIGFTTKNISGSHIVLPQAVVNHILSVSNWVYNQHTSGLIPSDANKASFINALAVEFSTMNGITINEILDGSPTVSQRMPDYISWTFTNSGTDNEIKIWFADSKFRTQYDDFEITIIPPIPVIDNLNNNSAVVNALLVGFSGAGLINAVETAAANTPYTKLVSKNVVWNDPAIPNVTLNTNWTAVIYGAAGNDNEAIKTAIRNYIGSNSTLTVWDNIFPTLYAENEFIVIPMWLDTAIAPAGLDYGIYSPAINVGKLMTTATAYVPATYAQSVVLPTYFNSHLVVANAFFRSLAFMVIGNPNNSGGVYSFKTVYPDYIDVQTDSPDWGRMTVNTRAWVTKINDAFEKAMVMTDTSSVPVGYTRVTRNNKVYLAFVEGLYNYLVLTKHSYTV